VKPVSLWRGARVSAALPSMLLATTCAVTPSSRTPPTTERTGGEPTATENAGLADAIGGIVASAKSHQVVVIGEIHGSVTIHSFLRSLLADPRLPALRPL